VLVPEHYFFASAPSYFVIDFNHPRYNLLRDVSLVSNANTAPRKTLIDRSSGTNSRVPSVRALHSELAEHWSREARHSSMSPIHPSAAAGA
jgi:hypothetical protein